MLENPTLIWIIVWKIGKARSEYFYLNEEAREAEGDHRLGVFRGFLEPGREWTKEETEGRKPDYRIG
jgi:hypothetical protein